MSTTGGMNGARWRALLWFVVAAAVALGCAFDFRQGAGVETNLLTLLPATERNPVAETVATRMAEGLGNRVVFLVGAPTLEAAAQAAREFGAELRQSPALRGVVVDLPPIDVRAMADLYLPHRFELLSAQDRAALTAGQPDLAGRLAAKLYAPPRLGLATPIAADPFGFLDQWLASLPFGATRLAPMDGVLAVQEKQRTWVLVAGELSGSAYDATLQTQLTEAVEAAESRLKSRLWEARLVRAGTVFYAQAARAQAQHEFDFIGAGSLVGMLAMLFWVFRSPGPLVLGVLSVAFGVGCAALATRHWFGQIHLITLVFGASLIGEAVDYSIQYFAARLGAGPAWDPIAGARRIAPGLLAALATSLLGYGVLALSPFVALAQIGFFAVVGLTAAWLTVFWLLPGTLTRPAKSRPHAPLAFAGRVLGLFRAHVGARGRMLIAVVLVALAVPGALRLHADDDVRLLVSRDARLVAQEAEVRQLTGLSAGSQFFLVEGADEDAVLRHEEALVARLAPLAAPAPVQAVSVFVPSRETKELNRTLWRDQVIGQGDTLEKLLAEAGVREQVAARLRADFVIGEGRPFTVSDWLASPVSIALRTLWQGETGHGMASVVPAPTALSAAQLQAAAHGLEGVTLVDKAGSVSTLFGQYRKQSGGWLAGAVLLVFVVLTVRYGWRRAAVVLMPTLLALAGCLGVLGYAGAPITLFHHMGFMLVLGVGVNYAIFLCEGGTSEVATLAGVLLSAATTLLAYGLLVFSSMPALSGFGLTLLVGVGLAVVLAPLALPLAKEPVA